MIVSASRRTDIPAFYWPWMARRLAEGYALSRNPMNARQVRRVDLSEDAVDGVVLWTKNPLPAMDHLDALDNRAYYFQFTLTPYGPDVEPGLPAKSVLMDAMLRLIDRLGPARVQWRYDPILITDAHPPAWHEDQFSRMTSRLAGRSEGCTVSFLDSYAKIERNMAALGARTPDEAERLGIADAFMDIAGGNGMALNMCCESEVYQALGIGQGSCIDRARLMRISGRDIRAQRDRNQRPGCSCAASVDIGAYDSCTHFCRYCYANVSPKAVAKNVSMHDPASPLLIGWPDAE